MNVTQAIPSFHDPHVRLIVAAGILSEYGLERRRDSRMVVVEYLRLLRSSSEKHCLDWGVWQGYSTIYGLAVAFWGPLGDRHPHHCSESGRPPDLQIAYCWPAVLVLKKLTVLLMRSEVFALVLALERPLFLRKQVAVDLEFRQGPLQHRCWCVHCWFWVTVGNPQFGTMYHLARW